MSQNLGERKWLSLGQASAWLGVNTTTLRHWADSGVVMCYRTPGGHRRFAREDLEALVRPAGAAVLPSSWERTALARVQQGLQGQAFEGWQQAMGDPAVQRFRMFGRQLLSTLRSALEQRKGRATILDEVHKLGQDTAELLHETGLPLRQALLAYFFFQSALTDALSDVYPNESEEARASAAKQLEAMLREWLLATMEAYEPARVIQAESAAV
jgi:excisionase family DNA binding protein